MVTVGFIAMPHGLPESVRGGIGDEGVPFGGMPGNTVEYRADHLRCGHPLIQQCGITGQLGHDQLVDRHGRNAFHQALGALVEVRGIGRFDRQTPFGGLLPGDAIPGEQQPFRALVAQSVRP